MSFLQKRVLSQTPAYSEEGVDDHLRAVCDHRVSETDLSLVAEEERHVRIVFCSVAGVVAENSVAGTDLPIETVAVAVVAVEEVHRSMTASWAEGEAAMADCAIDQPLAIATAAWVVEGVHHSKFAFWLAGVVVVEEFELLDFATHQPPGTAVLAAVAVHHSQIVV